MVQIDQTVLNQFSVNEADIRRRKDLLEFTASEVTLLCDCQPQIEREIDRIVETLQSAIMGFEEIIPLLGDEEGIKTLCQAQRQYILDLFDGLYGAAYVKNRQRVGLVHHKIGLKLRFYLSTMSQLKKILCKVIETQIKDFPKLEATREALDKLLSFDTTLVLDTFMIAGVQQVESSKARIAFEAKGFERDARHFKELSQRDSLTHLYNHGTFQIFLKRDLLQAQRRHESIALIYLDIDDFKDVNDEEGHAAGDLVLKAISDVLIEVCRKVDVVCRYGGDEFSVILPSCNLQGAERVCHRIIERFKTRCPDISISFGVAQTGPDYYESPETLCLRTDQKMYEAKGNSGFYICK